jgi:hypothetical protein
MKLTIPEQILTSDIISSSATNTVSAYASGTTYGIGALVFEGDYVYESAKSANVGKTPHLFAGGLVVNIDWIADGFTAIADPSWINMRKINPLLMFDSYLYTQTTKTGVGAVTLDVKYSKGNCTGVYLLNIDATSVTIVIKDSVGILLKTITTNLITDICLDEYDWCWSPIPDPVSDIYIDYNLVTSANDTVQIIFNSTTSVAVGKIVTGYAQQMGNTQWGYDNGILDFSKKVTDDYGSTFLQQGKYAKTIKATCIIGIADADAIWSRLVKVRAQNIVVDFNESGTTYSHLINYGLVQECRQSAVGFNDTKISMTINGSI